MVMKLIDGICLILIRWSASSDHLSEFVVPANSVISTFTVLNY